MVICLTILDAFLNFFTPPSRPVGSKITVLRSNILAGVDPALTEGELEFFFKVAREARC